MDRNFLFCHVQLFVQVQVRKKKTFFPKDARNDTLRMECKSFSHAWKLVLLHALISYSLIWWISPLHYRLTWNINAKCLNTREQRWPNYGAAPLSKLPPRIGQMSTTFSPRWFEKWIVDPRKSSPPIAVAVRPAPYSDLLDEKPNL